MSDLILSKEGFGGRLYDRFPPRYREDDIDTNFALLRYLEATAEGGFNYAIDEWNGILDFANPDQASSQAIPILFKQFGLEVFNGIPETFLRYLLPRLGMAWSKKGGMDVVEFVASSILGVKATTKVYSKSNGDANVDIRLYMDIAITDQMPDIKQFLRIIYHFLPFYLDMRVVLVYVYHDKITLVIEPYHLDKVIHTTNEEGFISHDKGEKKLPLLYPAGKLLNVDFILNDGDSTYPDPDVFFDWLTYAQSELGVINQKYVKERFDVIKRSPILDVIKLESNNANDPKIDHMVMTTPNTPECGAFSVTDRVVTCGMTHTYKATAGLKHTDLVFDVMEEHPYSDNIVVSGEDTLPKEVIIPSSNEKGILCANEEVTSVEVSNSVTEVAVIVPSALWGLFTNTEDMMLNVDCDFYDGYDIVQYRGGTKEVVFF